jgi:uncharacterized protein
VAENLLRLVGSPGSPLRTEGRLMRAPVAVGEAKWGRSVDGTRLRARLTVKAAALTEDVDHLSYIVCAREVRTPGGADTIVITAADIFPDPR